MQKDDVIYRQVAIDAINECFKKVVRAGNMSAYEYDSAYAQGEIDAYVTAIDTLKTLTSVKPEPKWILCSERLPEENGQYLITIKYKHFNDSYEDVYAEHGEWIDGEWDMFCFGHCGEVEDIIAWMPLPEPYKEGERSE